MAEACTYLWLFVLIEISIQQNATFPSENGENHVNG